MFNDTIRSRSRIGRTSIHVAILLVLALFVSALGLASHPVIAEGNKPAKETGAGSIDLFRPADCPSICKLADLTRLEPPALLTGETATVVLPIHATCATAPTWLRIMIVVDPSSQIDNRELDEVKTVILRLADQLQFGQGGTVELGLIQVTTVARVLSPYTSDRDEFERALNRLRRDETLALDRAIDAARREYNRLVAPDCLRGVESNEDDNPLRGRQ